MLYKASYRLINLLLLVLLPVGVMAEGTVSTDTVAAVTSAEKVNTASHVQVLVEKVLAVDKVDADKTVKNIVNKAHDKNVEPIADKTKVTIKAHATADKLGVAKAIELVAPASVTHGIMLAKKSDDTLTHVLHEQKVSSLHKHQPVSEMKLSSFLNHSEQVIRLNGSYDSVAATIPVSKRVVVESMKLHLVFSNSLSLAKLRSQLRFRFNERVIGQVKLDPEYPEGEIDLMIPLALIHEGNNTLTLESSLYTPINMPSFGASELWAEIDAKRSTLTLMSQPRSIELKFSVLQDLVRGSSWNGHYPLSVLMAQEKPSDVLLNAASNAVQGMALLTEGMPVDVRVAHAEKTRLSKGEGALSQLYTPFDDIDGVLIGTYEQLEHVLGSGVIDASVADEQLLLKYHPLDASSFVLVVAGKTESDVLSAARHFTLMNLPLANRDHISFNSSNVVSDEAVKRSSKVLKPMMRYNFSQLGIENSVLKKTGDYIDLPLRMPADLFAIKDNHVEVSFHFAYSPGMAAGSKIKILLNGAFQYAIPTDDLNGMLISKYLVKLPLRSLKKGMNTLRIVSTVLPGELALKNDILRKNIKISIYSDSIVRIPDMSQYARLPDLSMFEDTGYPYVEHEPSKIALAAANDTNLAVALTLAGKMSQLQKRPTPELTLTSNYNSKVEGSVILVGSLDEIEPEVITISPFQRKGGGFLLPVVDPYSDQGVPHNFVTTMVGFEHVIDAFSRTSNAAQDLQFLDMNDHAVLSQFEMPWSAGDSLTLFTTADSESLLAAVYKLVDPQLWSDLRGDTFIWTIAEDMGTSAGYSLELSDEYHTGSLSLPGKVAYYAISYPAYLIVGVMFLVIFLTWVTRRLMILQHKDRL